MHAKTILYAAAIAAAAVAVFFVVKGGKAAVTGALASVNPTNPNNIVNQAANKVYQSVTGDSVNSIGTAIADLVDRVTTNSGAAATAPSMPMRVFPAPDFKSAGGEQGFIL